MKYIGASEFEAIGGAPSGNHFSSYTGIYRLLEKLYDLETAGNYLNKKHQDVTFKPETKIIDYLKMKGHTGEVTGDKKKQEIQAVEALNGLMRDQVQKAKVCQLLDKMAKTPMALISNSGNGWINLLTRRTISLMFNGKDNTNAAVTKTQLTINPGLFWKTENLATGLLVHEYHHCLTYGKIALYADEYMAQWKQYTAMKLPKAKFDNLNHFLLDDPKGYKLRKDVPRPYTKPEDAGANWAKYMNNQA